MGLAGETRVQCRLGTDGKENETSYSETVGRPLLWETPTTPLAVLGNHRRVASVGHLLGRCRKRTGTRPLLLCGFSSRVRVNKYPNTIRMWGEQRRSANYAHLRATVTSGLPIRPYNGLTAEVPYDLSPSINALG